MPNPTTASPVMLLSAEKDVLQGVLGAASPSRERDSILQVLFRSGMTDTRVQFTPEQVGYLGANLVQSLDLPALRGTKYDSPLARQAAQAVVERLGAESAR
jgi:hypothetical protein